MDAKLFKNYLYNMLYQVIRLILPLFTVAYLYSHVGEATLGINQSVGAIGNWFVLFGVLGINVYGNREIARVRNDREKLSKTFFEIFSMQFLNVLLVSIIYIVYVVLFVKSYLPVWYLFLLTLLASALDISWLYYGVEDFKSASLRNAFVKILGVIMIFVFVKSEDDLLIYVFINAFAELIGQAIMFAQLKKYVDYTKISLRDAFDHHFVGTLSLFVPTIAIQVYTLLDKTMLATLTTNTADLEIYATSQSFVKIFLSFITSIGSVMLPRVTNAYYNSSDGKEKAADYITITLKIALMIAIPMTVALIFVSPYFYPWYLKNSPSAINRSIELVQWSAPLVIAISISNVFGIQYLVPTAKTKAYSLSVIVGACINFVINYFLIPSFGGLGAAIGSIAAEVTVALVQYYFVAKEVHFNLGTSILKYIIGSALMGLTVIYVGNTLGSYIYTNAIQAIFGDLVYALVLLILKDDLFMTALGKLRHHNG